MIALHALPLSHTYLILYASDEIPITVPLPFPVQLQLQCWCMASAGGRVGVIICAWCKPSAWVHKRLIALVCRASDLVVASFVVCTILIHERCDALAWTLCQLPWSFTGLSRSRTINPFTVVSSCSRSILLLGHNFPRDTGPVSARISRVG